jgi:glutaminyl-tRNA synthetase
MGVLYPLKVIIENYPDGMVEEMDIMINPEDINAGTRKTPFSRVLYIEQGDFMEEPPKKFYRLAPGREVRLRNAYFITCLDFIKKNGNVVELRCSIDPKTKGGDAPDGRKVKSTLHWVSATHAIDAEVRLYDRLFTVENPMGSKSKNYRDVVNPHSFEALTTCKVEPALRNMKPFDRFQFERIGYFCVDPDTTERELILNRTVGLRDTWAKLQKSQSKN